MAVGPCTSLNAALKNSCKKKGANLKSKEKQPKLPNGFSIINLAKICITLANTRSLKAFNSIKRHQFNSRMSVGSYSI